jgi:hypothetical protein
MWGGSISVWVCKLDNTCSKHSAQVLRYFYLEKFVERMDKQLKRVSTRQWWVLVGLAFLVGDRIFVLLKMFI